MSTQGDDRCLPKETACDVAVAMQVADGAPGTAKHLASCLGCCQLQLHVV